VPDLAADWWLEPAEPRIASLVRGEYPAVFDANLSYLACVRRGCHPLVSFGWPLSNLSVPAGNPARYTVEVPPYCAGLAVTARMSGLGELRLRGEDETYYSTIRNEEDWRTGPDGAVAVHTTFFVAPKMSDGTEYALAVTNAQPGLWISKDVYAWIVPDVAKLVEVYQLQFWPLPRFPFEPLL